MMFTQFCIWWYGRGWHDLITNFPRRIHKTAAAFSISVLIRTLFAPWRRIISHPGAGMSDRFNAWLDNMVSRVIGFLVRSLVLIAAGFTVLGTAIITAIEIVLWPCIPLAIIGVIIAGIMT
jgi:hypothetical protein